MMQTLLHGLMMKVNAVKININEKKELSWK